MTPGSFAQKKRKLPSNKSKCIFCESNEPGLDVHCVVTDVIFMKRPLPIADCFTCHFVVRKSRYLSHAQGVLCEPTVEWCMQLQGNMSLHAVLSCKIWASSGIGISVLHAKNVTTNWSRRTNLHQNLRSTLSNEKVSQESLLL